MKSSVLDPTRVSSNPALYPGAFTIALNSLFHPRATDTTELVLVRHAEPDGRIATTHIDPFDPPLSERGRCQAILLAQRLKGRDLDAVYTSTMRRALETAAIIGAASGLPVISSAQLREIAMNPRALNGYPGDQQKLASDMVLRFINKPRWDAIKGLEPSRQFRHRVIQEFESIAAQHTAQRVVVVTHAGPINAYLSMILGIERDMFFLPEYASISSVRILHDLYSVQNLNDASHLDAFTPKVNAFGAQPGDEGGPSNDSEPYS
jgi:probable phosphoglycerate mutase